MPNNITNKIVLNGSDGRINELIEQFSTFHPSTEEKAHDGSKIYIHKETGEAGWLQEDGNFIRRNMPSMGIPEGFYIKMSEEWTRFPDFDKIIPMPKSLSVTSGSVGEMGFAIMTGHTKFISIERVLKRFWEMTEDEKIACIKDGITYMQNKSLYGFTTWYDWSIENWGTKWNSYECEKINDFTFTFQTAWSGVPNLIRQISSLFPDVEILYSYADEDLGNNIGMMTFKKGLCFHKHIEPRSKEAYELAFELMPGQADNYELADGVYQYKEEE